MLNLGSNTQLSLHHLKLSDKDILSDIKEVTNRLNTLDPPTNTENTRQLRPRISKGSNYTSPSSLHKFKKKPKNIINNKKISPNITKESKSSHTNLKEKIEKEKLSISDLKNDIKIINHEKHLIKQEFQKMLKILKINKKINKELQNNKISLKQKIKSDFLTLNDCKNYSIKELSKIKSKRKFENIKLNTLKSCNLIKLSAYKEIFSLKELISDFNKENDFDKEMIDDLDDLYIKNNRFIEISSILTKANIGSNDICIDDEDNFIENKLLENFKDKKSLKEKLDQYLSKLENIYLNLDNKTNKDLYNYNCNKYNKQSIHINNNQTDETEEKKLNQSIIKYTAMCNLADKHILKLRKNLNKLINYCLKYQNDYNNEIDQIQVNNKKEVNHLRIMITKLLYQKKLLNKKVTLLKVNNDELTKKLIFLGSNYKNMDKKRSMINSNREVLEKKTDGVIMNNLLLDSQVKEINRSTYNYTKILNKFNISLSNEIMKGDKSKNKIAKLEEKIVELKGEINLLVNKRYVRSNK